MPITIVGATALAMLSSTLHGEPRAEFRTLRTLEVATPQGVAMLRRESRMGGAWHLETTQGPQPVVASLLARLNTLVDGSLIPLWMSTAAVSQSPMGCAPRFQIRATWDGALGTQIAEVCETQGKLWARTTGTDAKVVALAVRGGSPLWIALGRAKTPDLGLLDSRWVPWPEDRAKAILVHQKSKSSRIERNGPFWPDRGAREFLTAEVDATRMTERPSRPPDIRVEVLALNDRLEVSYWADFKAVSFSNRPGAYRTSSLPSLLR